MQRYFIDDVVDSDHSFSLDTEDNHHLVRVMRARIHDKVFVVDKNYHVYLSEVVSIDKQQAMLSVLDEIEEQKELPVTVTIVCGLSKNDKLDYIVQKGTECGMNQFIPLSLERDVVKWQGNKAANRIDRLQKIAKEAAEQSHRTVIPKIQSLTDINQLINNTMDYDHKLIAYEETAKDNKHGQLKETLSTMQSGESLIIIFGSEGGLSPLEVDKLKEVGYIESSLGPRILRAETAPIYALSAISYHFEC